MDGWMRGCRRRRDDASGKKKGMNRWRPMDKNMVEPLMLYSACWLLWTPELGIERWMICEGRKRKSEALVLANG